MDYEFELLKLIPKEKVYVSNFKNLKTGDMNYYLSKHKSVDAMKCSKSSMIKISEAICPYIVTNILKVEIIDNGNDIEDYKNYCFFYENDKLEFVIVV